MAGGSDYKEEKGQSGYECACCDSLIIGAKPWRPTKLSALPHSPSPATVVFIVNEYRKSTLVFLSVICIKQKINETNSSIPLPTVSFYFPYLCCSKFGIKKFLLMPGKAVFSYVCAQPKLILTLHNSRGL